MAEIKIEKKKPIWPWIVLALILIVIIYFVVTSQENDDFSDDSEINEIENTTGAINNDSPTYESRTIYEDASNEMQELSEVMKDSSRLGIDSTYTSRTLSDLVARTLKLARNHSLQTTSELSNLEQYATTIPDAKVSGTSKNFKTVSSDIVKVIENLQSNNAPGLQQKVEKLKGTASKINATTDLSKQQSSLQAFFRSAHELLNNLTT